MYRFTHYLTVPCQYIWQAAVKHRPPVDYVTATLDASDVIIDCAIPDYGAELQFDLPYCETAKFSTVASEYQDLFSMIPRWRIIIFLHIHVPPRRVKIDWQDAWYSLPWTFIVGIGSF